MDAPSGSIVASTLTRRRASSSRTSGSASTAGAAQEATRGRRNAVVAHRLIGRWQHVYCRPRLCSDSTGGGGSERFLDAARLEDLPAHQRPAAAAWRRRLRRRSPRTQRLDRPQPRPDRPLPRGSRVAAAVRFCACERPRDLRPWRRSQRRRPCGRGRGVMIDLAEMKEPTSTGRRARQGRGRAHVGRAEHRHGRTRAGGHRWGDLDDRHRRSHARRRSRLAWR